VLHAELVAFLEKLPRYEPHQGPDRLARAIAAHAEAARRRAAQMAEAEAGTPAPRPRLMLIRNHEVPPPGQPRERVEP
jgi:hypothetical protein